MALPPTSIASPWALVRRAGDKPGRRPSTRVAYLVGPTRDLDAATGQPAAMTAVLMRGDLTGRSRTLRRVAWGDVLKAWRWQPSRADVAKAKRRLPIVPATSDQKES